MKKLLLLASISILLFLGSCASKATSFAESLPDDEIAVIHWNGMDIIEYNGIKVKWNISAFGWLTIKIPGGDTRFILEGQTGTAYMGFVVYKNIPFSYNFEKGKEYTVMVGGNGISVYSGKPSSSMVRLASFDMTNGQQKARE